MLIEIDASIETALKQKLDSKILTEKSNEIDILENLAKSYKNSDHIIIGNNRILEFLSNLEFLDKKTREIYNHLFLNNPQKYKAYKQCFKEYIKVVSNTDSFEIIYQEKSNSKIYQVPLNYFEKDNSLLNTPILLTKNIRDSKLYEKMTKKFINEKLKFNIKLNLELSHGGGQDLALVYETTITSNRLVLCIADSDKKFPKSNNGQTARDAENKYNQYRDSNITNLHILRVREKENLIPPSIYSLFNNNIDKNVKALVSIEKKMIFILNF